MGVGGSPRATASGSALCAARVWPVCGTRRRVDSGKSDVRPRWRAGPKNVALFLAKMYHSGKNSKPKVERNLSCAQNPVWPPTRKPNRVQTGSGADRASQQGSRGSIPALPLTSPRSSCRDHTPPVPSVSVGGLGDVSSLRSSMTRKTRTFRKSPAFY